MRSHSTFLLVLGVLVLLEMGGRVAGAQLCGDADGDGSVTDTDGVQLLRAAVGLSSVCTPAVCDVDGDGSISDTDGVNLLRAAVGLPSQLSCASGPKQNCRQSVRAGNLTSAAELCASAAASDPNDAEVRGLAAGASAVAAAFATQRFMDLIDGLGFGRSGSASDICGASFAEPNTIPPGAPRTAAIQAALREQGLGLVDTALAQLSDVPQSVAFGFDLGNLPACTALSGRPFVDVDFGDVLIARFALNLLAAVLHAGAAYNVDFDLRGPVNNNLTPRDVFAGNPNLLTRLGGSNAAAELDLARSRLDAALSAFVAAVNFIDTETDDQSNDLFIILPGDRQRVLLRREGALRLQTALRGTATFEASVFGLTANQRLSLKDFFDGGIQTLRPFVPGFDARGNLDPCQFSDPRFGGRAPDMTRAELARLLEQDCP